jgi:hypothetical protein
VAGHRADTGRCPLVLTFDGKGIVMLPDALRPATAKAAAAAEGKLAMRLSTGEKNGRKRMAELACVYDAVPAPRTPEEIISTPAQKRRKKKAQAARPKSKEKLREPQAPPRRGRGSGWSPLLPSALPGRTGRGNGGGAGVLADHEFSVISGR